MDFNILNLDQVPVIRAIFFPAACLAGGPYAKKVRKVIRLA